MGIKELGYAKLREGPGGCSPQNIPVCTIHLTSQLMWLLSLLEHDRCPNSPYDNLWFTFCSRIYQSIRYSGKSFSNFAAQGGKKGARSSHAAWIRPLKRPRSQIDVHTYKVILFLPDGFRRHCFWAKLQDTSSIVKAHNFHLSIEMGKIRSRSCAFNPLPN